MQLLTTDYPPTRVGHPENKRTTTRQTLVLPARLTWKDQRGATRFASVMTRNVSDHGVYVECQSAVSIPLFRLVQFQIERGVHDVDGVPEAFRQGRILSAVYRISPPNSSGTPQGLALRLMVDPRRRAASSEQARATA